MRTEEEKGRALFARYQLQTDQKNEMERRETMAAITQHYDDTVFTQFITSQDVEEVPPALPQARMVYGGTHILRHWKKATCMNLRVTV